MGRRVDPARRRGGGSGDIGGLGRDDRIVRRAGLPEGRRQRGHQRRLGEERKLRGQRRRPAASDIGVAAAALRPDQRANPPVTLDDLGKAVGRDGGVPAARRCRGLHRRAAAGHRPRPPAVCAGGVVGRCEPTDSGGPADRPGVGGRHSTPGTQRAGRLFVAAAPVARRRRRRADRPGAGRLRAVGRCAVGRRAQIPRRDRPGPRDDGPGGRRGAVRRGVDAVAR